LRGSLKNSLRILLFSIPDGMKNKSGGLETIAAAAIGTSKSPLPDPPPQAGEEKVGVR